MLIGGGNYAWAQVSTWTFSSTNSDNTYGAEFEGSKSGIVKVQLGATSEASGWSVFHYGDYDRGVYYTVAGVGTGVTLSSEVGQEAVPVSGTFMTVKPQYNMTFSVKVYNDKPNGVETKQYVYIANASNPSTKTQSEWRVSSPGESTQTYSLTAGETYYIYMGSSSYGFASFTAKTANYKKLEDEIVTATSLKATEGYDEGQSDLQSAIDAAQAVIDNSSSTDANYVTAARSLIVAEELFTALNTKNTTYAVSASSLMSDGTVSKIVYGMTMTYHGTWSYEYNSGRFGHAARASSDYNNTVTDNIPTDGEYIEFVPSVSGNLQIKGMFYGGHTDAVLVNGSTKAIVKEYSNKNNDWSYVDFGYLTAGTTYYFYSKSKGDWGNGISAFIYTTSISATITAAGYATFNSDYPLNLDGIYGGKAFIVEAGAVEGDKITLTEQTGTVAANTGLILKTTGGAEGTIIIPVVASGSDISATNKLVAVTANATPVAINDYVLGCNDDYTDVGLYKLTAASTLNKGQAYLPASFSSAKALRFVIDGEATEVTAPEVAETEEPEILYNMAGQIVGKDFKGFVVNQKGVKRFNK